MTAQCSGCFYGQGTNVGGQRICRQSAPSPSDLRGDFSWWPPVNDTDWCGFHVVSDPTIYGSTAHANGSVIFAGAVMFVDVADPSMTTNSFPIATKRSSFVQDFWVDTFVAGVGFRINLSGISAGGETFGYIIIG